MDFQEFAMAGFVVIGLVNGIQFAINKQWDRFAMFVAAVASGTIFGFLQWFGLPSIEVGLAIGISSSGVYKIAQKLGGK